MVLKDFDLCTTLRKLIWIGSISVPVPEDTKNWLIGDDYYCDPNTHEPAKRSIKIDLEMLVDLIARANRDLNEIEWIFDLALLLEEKVAAAIAYNLSTSCTEWRWLVVEAILEAIASKEMCQVA